MGGGRILPVLRRPVNCYDAFMSKEKSDSTAMSIRVLLVDNEKDHASAMTESLERIGLECAFATSGPEGVQMLSKNNYDIVVTDLMMNEVDGMGILKHTKDTQPECEVILVTGHATVPRAVEAMREGAINFLEKPITPKRCKRSSLRPVNQSV